MDALIIKMPCRSEQAAEGFAEWLREQEVDAHQVDGRTVEVPTTYLPFVWDIVEAAVENGFADDSEAAKAAAEFVAAGGAR